MLFSAKSSIGIYQPFYKAELLERLDDGFIALDWMANPAPALRELALHHHIASEKIYLKHRLTGLLSAKFFSKTQLGSWQVYSWIEDNPGRDLYLISGAPFMPYQNYNGIERNDHQSPGFEDNLRTLCEMIGLDLPQQFPRQNNANCASCNFWIASAGFWQAWHRDVVGPIFEIIRQGRRTDKLLSYGKYPAPTPVLVLTLIYERLIDLFVARQQVNAIYYPWNAESVLSLHGHPAVKTYLAEMIPLVDPIDARGEWRDHEKVWLRERYGAVTREVGANSAFQGFGPSENLASDPVDFDLPRRFPGQHRVNLTGG